MPRSLTSHLGRTICTPDFTGLSGNGQAATLLDRLLSSSIVLEEDWHALEPGLREAVLDCNKEDELLGLLVQHNLLTAYQAARVNAGTTFGLVLGSYRVLERLG